MWYFGFFFGVNKTMNSTLTCTCKKVRDIVYFLLIYYGVLLSFGFGAMVLFAPDHEGFDNFFSSIRSMQRLATNEISITEMVQKDPATIRYYVQIVFHVVYLCLFKWLLTEAVFLGLILDSWVRNCWRQWTC